MKNLGTLFGYEMKKLWKRPLTWLTVLVFSAGFVYYAPIPFYHYDNTFTVTLADGQTISREVTAEEQDRLSIEAPRLLSGQVMDEAFFQRAQDIRSKLAPEEQDTNLTGAYAYFQLVDPTYLGAYQLLTVQDWYLHRLDRFREAMERSWGNSVAEEEITYWERMEKQIEQPFIYEPTGAPNRLFDVLGTMGIFIPVLVSLCVCDLFSQERRAKTYPQIFTSKQGGKCLFLAKTLAGGVTSMLAAAVAIGAVIGSSLIRYGTWGWGAAIQQCRYMLSCSLPITAWQGILLLSALMLVYALLCGALISAVSLWSGSGVAALAVGASLVGGQMLIVRAGTAMAPLMDLLPFLYNAFYYLPIGLVSASALIEKRLVHLFGLLLDPLQAGIIVYLAVTAALTVLCWLGWRRQEVGRT